MITIYKRETGVYYLNFNFAGKKIRKSLETKDLNFAKVVAEQYVKTLIAQTLPPPYVSPVPSENTPPLNNPENNAVIFGEKPKKLDSILKAYFPFLAKSGKRKTSITQETSILKRFSRENNNPTLQEITPPFVLNWINSLTCSPNSKKSLATVLKAGFSNMVKCGVIENNPIKDMANPKGEVKAIDHLTNQQVESLIEEVNKSSQDIRSLVYLCLYAGLRQAEAMNCQWNWFDLDRGLLTVKQENGFQTKNGKERSIPLHPRLIEIYQEQVEKSGYVIGGKEKPLTNYWLEINWNPIKEKLGIKNLHTLRKSFGSLLLQQGVPIEKISAWLGHANIGITQSHYASITVAYDKSITLLN